MKKLILLTAFSIISILTSYAQENKFNPKEFALNYFNALNKTQAPNSSKKDLEAYLDLLTDDAALQHLPFDTTDVREPNGKDGIRKGMEYWRGKVNNRSYKAKLLEINYEHNVVIIKFQATYTVEDKKTKKIIRSGVRNNLEVLEIENGKISIIRRYGIN